MTPCAANKEQQLVSVSVLGFSHGKNNITADQIKAVSFDRISSKSKSLMCKCNKDGLCSLYQEQLIGVCKMHKCHSNILHVLLSYSSVTHCYSKQDWCIIWGDYLEIVHCNATFHAYLEFYYIPKNC